MLPSIYKRFIKRGAAYTVSRSVIRSFTGSSLVNLKATESTAEKRKVTASKLRIEKNPSIPVERRKLYVDGSVYEGGWTGDVWAGYGKLTSATGQVWKGEFKEGKVYNGSGVLVFPDGDLYDGKWVNGKTEGQGEWTQTNGSYLKGEFKSDSLYDGTGVLVNPDGTVLQGIWKLGRLEGKFTKHGSLSDVGISAPISGPVCKTSTVNKPTDKYKEVINPDGSVLKGEFKRGRIYNGSGTMHLPDGAVHEGTWVKGMMEGHGKQATKKMCYVGEFVNDLKQGYGTSTRSDGSTYEGEWIRNKMHGQGKMTFLTGQVHVGVFRSNSFFDGKCYFSGPFEGTWVSGNGEGYCELINADDSVLKGEFKEGKIYNGSGVLKYTIGAVLEGTWVKGCMEGEGRIVYHDGCVYEGEILHGMKSGKGKYTTQYGRFYEGEFYMGQHHGHGIMVGKNNHIYEGSWKDGYMHGQGRMTCAKGVAEGEFKSNWMHNGKGLVMHKNLMSCEGEWKEGVFYGTITDSDGVTKSGEFSHQMITTYALKAVNKGVSESLHE